MWRRGRADEGGVRVARGITRGFCRVLRARSGCMAIRVASSSCMVLTSAVHVCTAPQVHGGGFSGAGFIRRR